MRYCSDRDIVVIALAAIMRKTGLKVDLIAHIEVVSKKTDVCLPVVNQ